MISKRPEWDKMWKLWTVLLLVGGSAQVFSVGGGVDTCNRVADSSAVKCRVRILDIEGASIEKSPSEGIRNLDIECNNMLLFESSVQVNYFKKYNNVDVLSIKNCKLLRIPGNTFEGLRQLKRLSIQTRNSEWSAAKNLEFSLGAFNGLKELQTVDLAYNNIKAILSDVFCSLDNVHTVNLTHNKLKSVDRLGFGHGCGSNIQNLDLSNNELNSLPENSDIIRLRRLQHLNLQHNNITDISADAFNGLVSLRILNMSYNNIQSLPDAVFYSTRDLREIYLRNNGIFDLAKNVFQRLEQLLVLDLSNNLLSSNHIDDRTFIGLIRLIVLNLSNNALTRIDSKTFKDLFFLQILDLKNNSIGFIEENTFLPLYNLHTLNLAENRLHTIEEFLFNGLYVLSKLTINNNLLVNIDKKSFKNCSDLKELDLSSNQLTEVPQALWELPSLKTLDLGENQITDLKNGTFKNLSQLTGLRMIENQIGNLSIGMFWDLPSLQVLNLAKNKIQAIERGTFQGNTQLEAIRFDGNFISDINGVFSTLASLLWLNLSENHLIWFDYAFIPSNLKWLDIHGNFIEHLGNYYKIKSEIRVKTLDASHNRLVDISPMSIPNSVELLFINNNFINNIHANTFIDKVNLTRVDMYANEITRFDLSSFLLSPVSVNKSLPEFYIGGNPLNCDCQMEWLPVINNMTLSSRQYPRVMDLENVMCKLTHSRSVSHKPLTSLKPIDFLCKYETHCFTLCHCCEFDACDCKMTCPQNCSCYHDPLWNSNVVDCSIQRVLEIPQRIPMDATKVYLDGNDFKELQNHVFIGKKNMLALYVNASGIENIQNRTFAGLTSLVILHLEKNKLVELKGFEFEYLTNLKELYLQDNMLSHIVNTTFVPMTSLKVLRLDGNRLSNFNAWSLNANTKLRALAIGNNLWSCKCSYLHELTGFIAKNMVKITDIADVFCWNSDSRPPKRKDLILNGTACSDYFYGDTVMENMLDSNYLPMMVLILTGIMLILLFLVLLFIFRDALRIWLYTHCGIRFFSFAEALDESDKLYDAYVCYSPKDEEFVTQSLAVDLENGNPSYQLCLHYRDIAHRGAPYVQCAPPLLEAAEASKRVILVLTRNFMQTEWSRFEFRQALHDALKGKIYKLVLIEDSSASSETIRDPELRPYLKTGARVKWGRKNVWNRIRFLMPEVSQRHKVKSQSCRRSLNTYTLDSSIPNGTIRSMSRTAKPTADLVESEEGCCPAGYCSEVEVEQTQLGAYGANGRPQSDHIYSSIDSDYSTLERGSGGSRRREPRHWPAPPPLLDPASSRTQGQAYLV